MINRLTHWRRRAMWRIIELLIPRCGWYNTILNTDIPNVGILHVKHLTVHNIAYRQDHEVWRDGAKVKPRHV